MKLMAFLPFSATTAQPAVQSRLPHLALQRIENFDVRQIVSGTQNENSLRMNVA
jgi:hypothetical protein